MDPAGEQQPPPPPLIRLLLRLRLWLLDRFRFGERQFMLVWAALIGLLGAIAAEIFRRATDLLHYLATGSDSEIISSFAHPRLWQRVAVPTAGGLLAGVVLWIGTRLTSPLPQRTTTDYMEAIVV